VKKQSESIETTHSTVYKTLFGIFWFKTLHSFNTKSVVSGRIRTLLFHISFTYL